MAPSDDGVNGRLDDVVHRLWRAGSLQRVADKNGLIVRRSVRDIRIGVVIGALVLVVVLTVVWRRRLLTP